MKQATRTDKDYMRMIRALAKSTHRMDIWYGHTPNKPWWRLSLSEQSNYIKRAESGYKNISI